MRFKTLSSDSPSWDATASTAAAPFDSNARFIKDLGETLEMPPDFGL
jgi:hypothetical protein